MSRANASLASLLANETLRLLELRRSGALPKWAAARLAEHLCAGDHRVLRVFPAAASRESGPGHGFAIAQDAPIIDELPRIVEDAFALKALLTRQPARSDDGTRLLIPLAAADEVRHLLELEGVVHGGEGAELARHLMPLIAAYYDLLADAETDPLTRLSNRRVFYTELGAGIGRLSTGTRRRYLAMADIDHFKQINDRFGHLYGDEILIHFARLMRASFRAGDLLYRFGGEEFVIIYAVDRAEDRHRALERFRAAVEAYEFPRVGRVTASLGFTAIDGPLVPATTFVDRADNAVYEAKRSGRNRICEYEALVLEGVLAPPKAASGGEATLF